MTDDKKEIYKKNFLILLRKRKHINTILSNN